MQKPDVLLIAPEDDGHLIIIEKIFAKKYPDLEVFRLSHADFPQKLALECHFSSQGQQHYFITTDQVISLENVRSVWWRRYRRPIVHPEVDDPEARTFAQVECEYALNGLWQSMPECLWVNPILADHAVERKPYQLFVAQQLGFRVPETLVTSAPVAARNFYEKHQGNLIFKKLHNIKTKSFATTKLTDKAFEQIEAVKYAPVIFQEFIPAAYDLRITVMGKHIFAARIYSQQSPSSIDWRWDSEVPTEKCDLPLAVNEKIHQLMAKLQLVYGAIDMRVTPEGEYVFFEINPAGQFIFIEIKTEMPMCETLVDLLATGKV